MRTITTILTMMVCSIAVSQEVATIAELDSLARKNSEAISVNAEAIQALSDKVDNIVSCTCDADEPTVGYKAPVKVPSISSMLDRMDTLIQKMESGKKLLSTPVTTQVVQAPPTLIEPPSVGSFDTVSSRVVSVGEPVITSVGTPRTTSTWVGSPMTYTGVCNNPNCNDPNCPNRLNSTNSSFNTMFSTGNVYSSGNNRIVRGKVRCENGVCYRIR